MNPLRIAAAARALAVWVFALSLVLLGLVLRVTAQVPDAIYRFRPGVNMSREYPFTREQQQTILTGLRVYTGFAKMGFDEAGRLDLGDRTQIVGGSALARRLVVSAADSSDSFILENRYHSATVAFAQIEDSDTYVDAREQKHQGWKVRLDLFDFTVLRGADPALAAFDPTTNLLHELIHGVLKLGDPLDTSDSLGECERHLNRIRAELKLPERQAYLPKIQFAVLAEGTAARMQAELIFVQRSARGGKEKNLHLTFALEQVCELKGAGDTWGCFRENYVAGASSPKR